MVVLLLGLGAPLMVLLEGRNSLCLELWSAAEDGGLLLVLTEPSRGRFTPPREKPPVKQNQIHRRKKLYWMVE